MIAVEPLNEAGERTIRAWREVAAAKLKCAESRTGPGQEDALMKFREMLHSPDGGTP